MCCDFEAWEDGDSWCMLYQGGETFEQDMFYFPKDLFSNLIFRHLEDEIVLKKSDLQERIEGEIIDILYYEPGLLIGLPILVSIILSVIPPTLFLVSVSVGVGIYFIVKDDDEVKPPPPPEGGDDDTPTTG